MTKSGEKPYRDEWPEPTLGRRAFYGATPWPMTNVRTLALSPWKALASSAERRCLVPLTEFCEWTPETHDLGDGKKPLTGEMWFQVTDQPIFAVAGFWQHQRGCLLHDVDVRLNELVAPIHPKAMSPSCMPTITSAG